MKIRTREVGTDEIEQHLKEVKVSGYTVVPRYLDSGPVKEFLGFLNAAYDAEQHQSYKGRQERELSDKMIYGLQNRGKQFLDLLDQPCLTAIMMDLLNDPFYKYLPPDVPNYILGFYNARSSGLKLDLHMDTFVPSPGQYTWAAQAAFVLEDSDSSNGCTTVVPGSHVSGRFVDRKTTKIEHIAAKAGDLVIWDSRLWHGASANTSGRSRWSMIATFTCWWVKQRMDMPRSLPQEIYRELSDRQKILLGFASIPPRSEKQKVNFKGGYEDLLPSVESYL